MEAIDILLDRYSGLFYALEITGIFFLALAIIELAWDWIAKTGRQFTETLANMMVAVIYTLSSNLIGGVMLIIAYFFIQPFALFTFEMTPIMWATALLLVDFSYYWMHRFEHEIRLLWAYHVVHHSSPEFDLTTAYRLSPIEEFFEWIFLVPMLVLGFDPIATLLALSINAEYQTWIHTQKIGKLGILDKLVNTPANHRVHHGRNPKYIDKNYGGIFMVWDHIFGTYQAEEEDVIFGITKPVNSINPFIITFHEFIAICKDSWNATTWAHKSACIFAEPGWEPAKTDKTKPGPVDNKQPKENNGTNQR